MPPLAHPEPLIPEHQRLRADPVDSACSSGSASSFFGRLWPNRRKSAPAGKTASVVSSQEICDSSCKHSTSSVRLCKGDNDANGWSMRLPTWILRAFAQSNISSVCIAEEQNVSHDSNSDLGTQVLDMHCKDLNAESFSHWELGVMPIIKSLKDVMKNKQRADNVEAIDVYANVQDRDQKTVGIDIAGVVFDEGDQIVRAEHMLTKRTASFKTGEAMKKLRLSTLCELQRVVSFLQCGTLEECWLAAKEVLSLCKDDPIARVTLGVQLRAIPPLLSLLHSVLPEHQHTALQALLNLAVGNDVNKAAIVEAKALQRMVALLQSSHAEVQAAAVTLFLSLSALDANKADIGTSGSIPLLVNLLHEGFTKKDALRALYNLSIHAGNIKSMIEVGCVPLLLHLISDINMADKALATLSNLAGLDVGRYAFGEHKELAYAALIDVMHWMDMPKCQERAVYVLMMIAHHSPVQREAMAAAGVIPALVEVSLLGSVLAQKRATRTLDSFRRAKAFSGPQQRQCTQAETVCANGSQSMTRALSEKKVVDGLVRQSLHRTLQRITRRANLSKDPISPTAMPTSRSFRRLLDRRSSSCSLPF
ncbi:hypothetical protein L7F22_049104 [Adiantum nelumboides]|nr:hypothetical protein [Adiantum nelumboides]